MRAAPKKLGRRELLRAMGGLGVSSIAGCARRPESPLAAGGAGDVAVWSCFDLPQEPRTRELSGVAWDAETQTLWAVQDERAALVPLRPDPELRRWSLGEPLHLGIDGPLDLEGVVITERGFLVASEIGPRIIEVDRAGRFVRDVVPPGKFVEAVANKSFESLALDPDRRVLYTTSETALPRDAGATPRDGDGDGDAAGGGPRVRIVRTDLATGAVTEHAYATDVGLAGGDHGVSEIAALATDDLFVLERGYRDGTGNTVRIYRVDLSDGASACTATERLAAGAAVLPKRLVVDLAKLPATCAPPPKQPQPTPLMENFEGLAFGPRLPDGRRSLVLVSDDNGRDDQTARVVVLAMR